MKKIVQINITELLNKLQSETKDGFSLERLNQLLKDIADHGNDPDSEVLVLN